jgi:hypothetical protein
MPEGIDVTYIKQKIQNIIEREHSNSEKKRIKSFNDRLNFACPICGDSEKSNSKKRGNLYLDNLYFKCFNCDAHMSFTKFCEIHNEQIDIDHKILIYKYIDDNVFYKKTDQYIIDEMDKLISLDKFVEYFNNKPYSWLTDVSPVTKNSHVYQYLKFDRLLENFSQIYQGVYRYFKGDKVVFHSNVLININMTNGDEKKILGIQIRNLEHGAKRFYKIIEFEELYNYMNSEPLDEMEAISYNKLSHFYNLMNIDFDQIITIFEGYLDSTFYPNSIGMVGAKNDDDLLKFLTQSDAGLKLQFFYDNDATGINKATKMIKNGHSVFLWNKLFKDLKQFKYKDLQTQIIDLNDLVKLLKDPEVYKNLNLNKYFSIDEFDLMYLDKVVFNREKKEWSIIRS